MKTNQNQAGYEVRDMNDEELELVDRGISTGQFEILLDGLEPAIVRSQFKRAVERLEELLEKRIQDEGAQGGRALLEKMALIAGDRRSKAMNVQVERRRS